MERYLETSENEHTTTPDLRDTGEAVLKEKFAATQASLMKQETSQITDLTSPLKELEKEQTRPKVSKK